MKHIIKKTVLLFATVFLSLVVFIISVFSKENNEFNDYADDRIIISFSNETSKKLKEYTPKDFPELDLERVSDLTQSSVEVLKKRSGNSETIDGVSIDKFNQTLCLYLKYKGYDKVNKALDLMKRRKDVIAVSPDYYTYECSVTYDDTYASYQWAIQNIQLDDAWEITKGSNYITVGVIDTGIQGDHPDLSSNIDSSKSVDCTVDPIVNVGVPTDSDSHGTHVAGIIGAKGNNGIGVAGCLWNLKLVSIKASNAGFGSKSYFVKAVDYATANNISILNCSHGWTSSNFDDALKIVISNYPGLFICSAGNTNVDLDNNPHIPSDFMLDNMIVVGAHNSNNEKRDSSNYGANTVHLFAPGGEIYSTVPTNSYAYMSGTSMAAPHVTGVAALIKSIRPQYTAFEIKKLILNSVDYVPALSGLCITNGKLNAYKAVRAATEQQTFFGDVNGDGYKDVIMSGRSSNNKRKLTTLLGNSFSWFSNETSFTSTRNFVFNDLAYPGDYNGDGRTDLLVMWNNGGYRQLLVYTGTSTGSFNEAVNLSSSRFHNTYLYPVKELVMDVNNDGNDDFVIVYKNSSGKIGILTYKGTNTSPYIVDATTNALTSTYNYFDDSKIYCGDFNGDNYDDILIPTYDSNEKRNITIFTGKSNGNFNEGQLLVSVRNHKPYIFPSSYEVGDYNGDGYCDFLNTFSNNGLRQILTYKGKSSVPYLNDAPNNNANNYNYSVYDYTFSGDVNGDGYDDLIVLYKNFNNYRCLRVYNGNSIDLFTTDNNTTTVSYHFESITPCSIFSCDVNNDGKCDIIVKQNISDYCQFLVYNGRNNSTFDNAAVSSALSPFYN